MTTLALNRSLPVLREPTALAPGRVVRRLEGTERLVAIGNARHRGHFNIVGAIGVDGPITHALLTHALEHLQRHHESLRVEVVPDPEHRDQFLFRHTDTAPRLEVTDEDWRAVWNRLSLEETHGLAWRLVWTPGHLLVLFHHAVTDGASISIFFDSLLETMSRAVEGVSDIAPSRLMLPPMYRLAGSRWPVRAGMRIATQNMLGGLDSGPVVKTEPALRRWHAAFRTLEPAATDALLTRCRERGVTLTHALTAAATLELAARVRSRKRFTVGLCTSVNLRSAVPNLDPQAMGLLSSAVHSFFPMRGGEELWSLAHEARRQLHGAIARQEPRDMPQLHRFFGPRLTSWLETHNEGRTPDCGVLLSNLGRLDGLEHGAFRTHSFFVTACQQAFGPTYLLVVATLRGRMCVHLGFATPTISVEEGEAALDGMLDRLAAPHSLVAG